MFEISKTFFKSDCLWLYKNSSSELKQTVKKAKAYGWKTTTTSSALNDYVVLAANINRTRKQNQHWQNQKMAVCNKNLSSKLKYVIKSILIEYSINANERWKWKQTFSVLSKCLSIRNDANIIFSTFFLIPFDSVVLQLHVSLSFSFQLILFLIIVEQTN